MSIDWERVVSAIIASSPDLKLQYDRIAELYGGTTKSAIEHRLRNPRRVAAAMLSGQSTEEQEAMKNAGSPKKRKLKGDSASNSPSAKKPAAARARVARSTDTQRDPADAEDSVVVKSEPGDNGGPVLQPAPSGDDDFFSLCKDNITEAERDV